MIVVWGSGYGTPHGSLGGEGARVDSMSSGLSFGAVTRSTGCPPSTRTFQSTTRSTAPRRSERLEFFQNALPGLKPNLKLTTGAPRTGPGPLAEPFPATHAFGPICQPERACDR